MKCGYSGSHQPSRVEIGKTGEGESLPKNHESYDHMLTQTEKDTRLVELVTEYLKATLLLEEGYVSYDKYEKVEETRGVLKDVCKSCLEEVYYDIDWCVSNGAGYEVHEDMTGGTCAVCGKDFWGMKGGLLVLFEPKFSLERWG